MIKVRSSTFETNSSSMHSLVISNKDRGFDYSLPLDENGILTLTFGDYGWGPNILKTPYDKLIYYLTNVALEVVPYKYINNFERGLTILTEEKRIKNLLKFIQLKCPEVKDFSWEPYTDEDGWSGSKFGNIDHESFGLYAKENPKDFVFNNSRIVLIDNDNSVYYEEYYGDDRKMEKLFEEKEK